ncbi:MAG: trimeric intracellular cation channel family protein [Burkholderiales bacterium]|jgi:uncharacterized membrane protein YeiH|nr:MAG: trimeric intracellular cation channel family protein [Burkholderiales bacterium]
MRAEQAVVPAIEFVAVLAAAFSGFAEARNKKMDPVGVFTVAFVTAFGGGTLRDVLLDRRPFFWVEHQLYVVLILVLTLIATPTMRLAQRVVPTTLFVVADAIGLGLFSIAGVSVARELGSPPIIAAMMGVVTGVFGGVLRDVILNEVPMVLRDGKPYALAALAGCVFFLLIVDTVMPASMATWVAAVLVVAVRLIAWRWNWTVR